MVNPTIPLSASENLTWEYTALAETLSTADTAVIKREIHQHSVRFGNSIARSAAISGELSRELLSVGPDEPGPVPIGFWDRLDVFIDELCDTIALGKFVSRLISFLPDDTLGSRCIQYSWCTLDLLIQQLFAQKTTVAFHHDYAIPLLYLEALKNLLEDQARHARHWAAQFQLDLHRFCPTPDDILLHIPPLEDD
jgi:hypothetical protein